MSERTLRRVLAVLGVLVLVWVVTLVLPDGDAAPSEEALALTRLLERADPEQVVAVHLPGSEGVPVRLVRDGGRWTVNGHLADSANVARFWEDVDEAVVGELAAGNPENHGRLGVDADSALTVVFERSGAADTLLVGKAGQTFGTVFARLPGEDAVFRLETDIRTAVTRTVDQWRDKLILEVDTARVATAELSREGESYTLARADSAWRVDGEPTDTLAVRNLLSELARIDAIGFAEEDGGGAADRAITVRDETGAVLAEIELREGDASTLLLRRGGGGTIFELSRWRGDRLVPTREELVAEAAPGEGG